MQSGGGEDDESEKALAELAGLLRRQMLRDPAAMDTGHAVEFSCGAAGFEEKLLTALTVAMTQISPQRLMALAISRAREERRQNGEPVLSDDDANGFKSPPN